VLVVTKRHANHSLASLLTGVPTATPIVLLQNGLEAVEDVRALLGGAEDRTIRHCVVAISATLLHAEGRVVRSGPLAELVLAHGLEALVELLVGAGVRVRLVDSERLAAESRGKLILNMLNAPNAISGKPILKMMLDRKACLMAADSMAELCCIYRALDLSVENSLMRRLPLILRLLSWHLVNWLLRVLFFLLSIAGKRVLDNDTSKSSTVEDLDAGRPTEIDYINGEVVKLGVRAGVPTPANTAAVRAVRRLEAEAVARWAA